MADKKVRYTDGAIAVELDKKDELHPSTLNPPKDQRLQTTKANAEDVAEAVAAQLEDRPDRLRLDAKYSPEAMREAARRSRASQLNAAAAKRIYELFQLESRVRRDALQTMLRAVYGQAKAQRIDDERLAKDMVGLFDYFKPNK